MQSPIILLTRPYATLLLSANEMRCYPRGMIECTPDEMYTVYKRLQVCSKNSTIAALKYLQRYAICVACTSDNAIKLLMLLKLKLS